MPGISASMTCGYEIRERNPTVSSISAGETLKAILTKIERACNLIQAAPPAPDVPVQVELMLEETLADIRKALGIRKWPAPTSERPDLETLEAWMWDSVCEATDGCVCEPDGICPHGHPSWLLRLGLI